MPTVAKQPSHARDPKIAPRGSPRLAVRYTRELGLVHRIDVGIHTLATERLIVELRSMDPGELSTLYSLVGRVVDPALVRILIAKPQTLEWRNIGRTNPHRGESYARQHTLYVHIYAPYEPGGSHVDTHEHVQHRLLEWLACDAGASSNQA